jgi:hypothetical protein
MKQAFHVEGTEREDHEIVHEPFVEGAGHGITIVHHHHHGGPGVGIAGFRDQGGLPISKEEKIRVAKALTEIGARHVHGFHTGELGKSRKNFMAARGDANH